LWRAFGPTDADPAAQGLAVAVFEEWARPLRIDGLHVEVGGFDVGSGLPSTIDAGEGLEERLLADVAGDRMTVRGLLWNRAIEYEEKRSRSLSKRWAALVFGSHLIAELEDDEMLQLALYGGAVSPVTSYLAIEPGARPSAGGLPLDQEIAGWIGKGGGGGVGRGYGNARGAGFGGRLDRQAWLDEQLHAAWLHCGGEGQRGKLVLETTYDEIVDFALTSITKADVARDTCMQAQTWALLLPAGDFSDDRAHWTVEL
jgi:hypothetical protein